MNEWEDAIAPAEVPVECGGQQHRLRWADGALHTPDHADPGGERTLAALGGEPSRCIQLLDAWLRHADDLDVLLLASRGPADPLAPSGERPSGAGSVVSSFARPSRAPRPGRRPTARGWTMYSPLGAGHWTRFPGEPEDELSDLLALGGGLPDRLVATVAATWAARLAAADPSAAAAVPALRAALYGRVLAAIRTWLGDHSLDLDLTMCPAGAPRSVTRDGAWIRAALPLAWLAEVWAAGLVTIAGRFCLAVTPTGQSLRLQVVGPDFGPSSTITLDPR